MTRFLGPHVVLALLALLLAPVDVTAKDEAICVVVNESVPVRALSGPELRAIYKREMRYWNDGSAIRPFSFPPAHALRVRFDQAVLGMNEGAATKFWIDQRVRGGPPPPRSVPNPALLARVVSSLAGAIAYVPASAVPAGTHVVARIEDGQVKRAMSFGPHFADARMGLRWWR